MTTVMNATATASPPPAGSDSFWTMTIAPGIWMVHFLACYVTAALACGRWSPADGAPLTAIAAYTGLAAAGIGWCVMTGLRARRDAGPLTRLDDDTPESRVQFVATATVLLALLSLVGALFVAAATVIVPVCA